MPYSINQSFGISAHLWSSAMFIIAYTRNLHFLVFGNLRFTSVLHVLIYGQTSCIKNWNTFSAFVVEPGITASPQVASNLQTLLCTFIISRQIWWRFSYNCVSTFCGNFYNGHFNLFTLLGKLLVEPKVHCALSDVFKYMCCFGTVQLNQISAVKERFDWQLKIFVKSQIRAGPTHRHSRV